MSINRYEKIILAAAKLMGEKGIRETSLEDIANKVGLRKSSLFHYFRNKEELVLRILEKPINEVSINLENIINNDKLEPEEKLGKAIDNHLTLLTKYLNNVSIYLNEIRLRSLSRNNRLIYLKTREKYLNNFGKIIGEMKTKGYFSGLNEKIVTLGVLGMFNYVSRWYEKDGPLTAKEISSIFYRILTKENPQKE
jgi:AcrR family transcriptional regulator